jgi:hypothetical protein
LESSALRAVVGVRCGRLCLDKICYQE